MAGNPIGSRGGGRMMTVDQIREAIRTAQSLERPLRIAGAATWLDAGRPVRAENALSLAGFSGVVDYVPGDLTITVRGGTPLSEIQRITEEHGQWWPLVPFGNPDGTVGATVSTASWGPLAHGFGTGRDLVLGIELVTGEGRVVRGGGRVVKNVAGFDLVRLLTGSWGTLGVITEITLRLHSIPKSSSTLAVSMLADVRQFRDRLRSMYALPINADAMELVDARLASKLGLPAQQTVLVRLGGSRQSVAAQQALLAPFGGVEEISDSAWDELRRADGAETVVLRLSGLPTSLADTWVHVQRSIEGVEGAFAHATISRGVVRCIIPQSAAEMTERLALPGIAAKTAYERLPWSMWPQLSESVTTDRLSRGIRGVFDPSGILNPGILGPIQ
jgi:glycolate oxidase FAD binding subunit